MKIKHSLAKFISFLLVLVIFIQPNISAIFFGVHNCLPVMVYASEVEETISMDSESANNTNSVQIENPEGKQNMEPVSNSVSVQEPILEPFIPSAEAEPTTELTEEPTEVPLVLPTEAPAAETAFDPLIEPILDPTVSPLKEDEVVPTKEPILEPMEELIQTAPLSPTVTPVALISPSVSVSPTAVIITNTSSNYIFSASPVASPSAIPTFTPKILPEQSNLHENAISRANTLSIDVHTYSPSYTTSSGIGNHPDFLPFVPEFDPYTTADLSEVENYLHLVDLDRCMGTITVTEVESSVLATVPEIEILDTLTEGEFEQAEEIYFEHKNMYAEADGYEIVVSGEVPSNAELSVKSLDIGAYVEPLAEMYGVSNDAVQLSSVMDISVVCDDVQYQPEEFGSSLEVTIKNMDSDSIQQIVHIHDDNYAEQISIVDENLTETTFNTNSFSVYTIGEVAYDTATATVYSVGNDLSGYLFADGVFIVTGTGTRIEETFGPHSTMANCPWENITHFYVKAENVVGTNVSLFQGNTVIKYIEFDCKLESVSSWAYREASNLETIVLPNTVLTIESNAFRDCSSLSSINMPNSLVSIKEGAFSNCTSLSSISLPDTLTEIGDVAFEGLAVQSIVIPAGITTLSHGLFYNAKVKEIECKGNIVSIDDVCFQLCSNLTTLKIPDTVKTISPDIFSGCSSLTNIDFLSNITEIPRYAFCDCTALVSTNIDYSKITSVGSHAFTNCTVWEDSLNFSGSTLLSIDEDAFNNCQAITNLVLGNSLTSLGARAFYNTLNLKIHVTLPAGITIVPDSCFKQSGITGLTCLGDVNAIEYCAVSYCTNLITISIPDTVTTLGTYCFAGNNNLTSQINFISNVESIPERAFLECNKIPSAKFSTNLSSIGEAAFKSCLSLKKVDLSNTKISSIGLYCFNNATTLEEVILPETLTILPHHCFDADSKLSKINLGHVTSIGWHTFYSCTSLEDIDLTSLTSLDSSAFGGNDVKIYTNLTYTNANAALVESYDWRGQNRILTSHLPLNTEGSLRGDFDRTTGLLTVYGEGTDLNITLSTVLDELSSSLSGIKFDTDTVMTIGSKWLYNQENIFSNLSGTLTLPSKLKVIGNDAFNGCNNFTGILTIPSTVETIEENAFAYCSGFTGNLVIPNSVTNLGAGAFRFCSGLNGTLTISNQLSAIQESSFDGCSSLKGGLSIPSSVKTIGRRAFQNCSSFTGDLIIPDSVTELGEYAFKTCSGFDGSLTLSNNLTVINYQTFQACNNLTGVLIIPEKVNQIASGAFGGLVKINKIYICGDVSTIKSDAFYCNISVPTKLLTKSDVALSYDWNSDGRPMTSMNTFVIAIPQEITLEVKYLDANGPAIWYSNFNMEIESNFEDNSYAELSGVPSFQIRSASGDNRDVVTNIQDATIDQNGKLVIPVTLQADNPTLKEEYSGNLGINIALHQLVPNL